jgi:hypothetical protein
MDQNDPKPSELARSLHPEPGTNEALYLDALHALLWDPTPFTDEEIEDLTKNGVDFGEVIPEIAARLEARRGQVGG